MFNHFHVQDAIKPLSRGGHIFRRCVAVIDLQSGAFGMYARHGDIPFGRVSAHDGRAQPCHGFTQQTAAAADVTETLAADPGLNSDE